MSTAIAPCETTAARHQGAPGPRDAAPAAGENLLPWSTILLLFARKTLVALLAFVLVLWNFLLLFGMMVLMPKNDFGRTFLSAAAFVRGDDMYAMNPSIPWWIKNDLIYLWNLNPPHFHILLLPLAWMHNDVALGVWCVFNAVCLILALKAINAEIQVEWTPPRRQLAILGMLAFIGTGTALVTGHITFMMLLLLTLSWRHARHGRWTRAGVYLALAISVKPFLLFLAPYFLWRRQWRAAGAMAATLALCFLAGLLVFGVANNRSWLHTLRVAQGWAWLPMNASLMGLLSRAFGENTWYAYAGPLSAGQIKAVWLALGIPLGLLSFAAVAGDATPRGVDRAFGLLLVGSLLLSPLGWTYYFPLALGPVLMLALGWWRERGAAPRWTWRQRLLVASLPGFMMPLFGLDLGQPFALGTFLFGSIYCWSLLFLWTALALDGFRHYRRRGVPQPAAPCAD